MIKCWSDDAWNDYMYWHDQGQKKVICNITFRESGHEGSILSTVWSIRPTKKTSTFIHAGIIINTEPLAKSKKIVRVNYLTIFLAFKHTYMIIREARARVSNLSLKL